MEMLGQYETQETQAPVVLTQETEATVVEVDSQSVATTVLQSDNDCSPTQVLTRSCSRSTSPITPPVTPRAHVRIPNVEVEHLPTRRHCRAVPDGPPQKGQRGWTRSTIAAAIQLTELEGSWRQGGKQNITINM